MGLKKPFVAQSILLVIVLIFAKVPFLLFIQLLYYIRCHSPRLFIISATVNRFANLFNFFLRIRIYYYHIYE